ncbi:hypothetical protein SPRG_01100 [Saprolegnia parasitica CBS 223.65]|uniref:Lysosomal cobalamin transporter n=1 Tax=Saprolegnia parasitica (strain CBS 223.65) TaxID=695850 RepID=A0A067D8Q6_SAPPC|nr:hypothetical protein SPRG_01100 [Saprolegnia parasitica CBS 223.65]KDO35036.1 hypothetical protein SPRG_01100 [Saprolegnia parasitica CBS 223.65]|eukprot:XP_012194689.1 hypothetical protein SPRG_01100 [Saprolegnia parasitica CBS 223.65]
MADVYGTYGIYALYAGVALFLYVLSYLIVTKLEVRPTPASEGLVFSQPDKLSRIMSILSLFFALLCIFTPPVDVYVTTTRHLNQAKAMGIVYDVLLVMLLNFSLLFSPFAFFYAKQSEIQHITRATASRRVVAALKRTACFLCFMLILVTIVLIVVLCGKPRADLDWLKPLLHLDDDATLVFRVFLGLVLCIGSVLWIWLAGRAIASIPVDGLLRPRRHDRAALSYLMEEIELETHAVERSRQTVMRKYTSSDSTMSASDRDRLEELKKRDQVLLDRRRVFAKQRTQWVCCTSMVWRVPIGALLMVISLLIVFSLLLTTIDKLMHGQYDAGFVLETPQLPNPIDLVLVLSSKVFPLDYALFACFFFYIFVSAFLWLSRHGFKFLCFRMDRLQRRNTAPSTLILATLAMIYLSLMGLFSLLTLAPQYATFGHQTFTNATTGETHPCTLHASSLLPEACATTQLARIFDGFAGGVPMVGAAFVFAQGAFALLFFPFVIQAYLLTTEPEDASDDPKRESLLNRNEVYV